MGVRYRGYATGVLRWLGVGFGDGGGGYAVVWRGGEGAAVDDGAGSGWSA